MVQTLCESIFGQAHRRSLFRHLSGAALLSGPAQVHGPLECWVAMVSPANPDPNPNSHPHPHPDADPNPRSQHAVTPGLFETFTGSSLMVRERQSAETCRATVRGTCGTPEAGTRTPYVQRVAPLGKLSCASGTYSTP